MQRRVCIELNRSLNEYESLAEELIRRLSAQQKSVENEMDLNECEAELRKETFDPMTKKFVSRARQLADEKNRIAADCQRLHDLVEHERDACFAKIRQHLGDGEIIDISGRNVTRTLARHEDLLDMRQELLTPPEVGI